MAAILEEIVQGTGVPLYGIQYPRQSGSQRLITFLKEDLNMPQ